MGDRANVRVVDEDSSVYLYTHWSGRELPETLRAALDADVARRRWQDNQYLTRIIFCRMVGKEDWDGETGYGISSVIGDNSYPILTVDVAKQEVRLHDEGDPDGGPLGRWTFEEYVRLPRAEWAGLKRQGVPVEEGP